MLTQEEYMDVIALRRKRWTIGQIAEREGVGAFCLVHQAKARPGLPGAGDDHLSQVRWLWGHR